MSDAAVVHEVEFSTWWLVVFFGLLFVFIAVGTAHSYADRQLRRWQKRFGPVPETIRPGLEARLNRDVRWGTIGGVIGAVLAALDLMVPTSAGGAQLAGMLLIGGAIVGSCLGSAASTVTVPQPDPSKPRLARPRATTLRDYASRMHIAMYVGSVISAVATLALMAALVATGRFAPGPLVRSAAPFFAILALVLAAISAGCLRRLLRNPQPAADEVELFWSDAVRGYEVNQLLVLPFTAGAWSVALLLLNLDRSATEAARRHGGDSPDWVFNTLVAALIGVGIWFLVVTAAAVIPAMSDRIKWHWGYRLWPARDDRTRA